MANTLLKIRVGSNSMNEIKNKLGPLLATENFGVVTTCQFQASFYSKRP